MLAARTLRTDEEIDDLQLLDRRLTVVIWQLNLLIAGVAALIISAPSTSRANWGW